MIIYFEMYKEQSLSVKRQSLLSTAAYLFYPMKQRLTTTSGCGSTKKNFISVIERIP